MLSVTLQMGALSVKSESRGQNEDGELTFLGRVLAHLPLDLYLGKMIVLGHVFAWMSASSLVSLSWYLVVSVVYGMFSRDIALQPKCVTCFSEYFCTTYSLILSCLSLSEELLCDTVHAADCWP